MSNSNLQNDIDYIKSLAVAGSTGPLRNGANLVWAGLLYGLAAVAQYAIVVGWLPRNGWISAVVWFGASLVFLAVVLICRFGRGNTVGSQSDKAAETAWSAVGLGIVAFIATTAIIANRVDHSAAAAITYTLAPVILLLYGIGWWVSAVMAKQNWLKLVALGCFAGAPLLALLSGMPEQLLAYALCLVLFATMPGIILMRASRLQA